MKEKKFTNSNNNIMREVKKSYKKAFPKIIQNSLKIPGLESPSNITNGLQIVRPAP